MRYYFAWRKTTSDVSDQRVDDASFCDSDILQVNAKSAVLTLPRFTEWRIHEFCSRLDLRGSDVYVKKPCVQLNETI